MMCWHHWTPWSKLVDNYDNSLWQFGSCKKCNAVKKRKVGILFASVTSITAAVANHVVELAREELKEQT